MRTSSLEIMERDSGKEAIGMVRAGRSDSVRSRKMLMSLSRICHIFLNELKEAHQRSKCDLNIPSSHAGRHHCMTV